MVWRLAPMAAALALGLPVVAGLALTLAAALGWLPAAGARGLTLEPLRSFLATPGLGHSLVLTLASGIGSTILALLGALALVARWPGAGRVLPPLLATPHAALALGLAFLLAPTGLAARLGAGAVLPPALMLTLGLAMKELPFLLFMALAAAARLPVAQMLAAGRALGHPPGSVWLRVVLPQLYPLIRLPVAIVMAYALSAVDMALILGPGQPPVLSVLLLRDFTDPDPAQILPASAGAVLLVALVAAVLALWRLAEVAVAHLGRGWIVRGGRGGALWPGAALGAGLLALAFAALVVLAIWAFAFRWSFPDLLPRSFTLRGWQQGHWARPAALTLGLAVITTALALALAVAWLEAEDRGALRRNRAMTALLLAPLVLPQIGFLFGVQALFLRLGLPGLVAVIWAQMLFVFPYVLLALTDPWRALDPRALRVAAALGAGPGRRLWAVKLPLLLAPLLAAAALGIAVSAAQYLPVLALGAGRLPTLATETVALASGADRRAAAVAGLLLSALPAVAYALALGLPRLIFANRRGLLGGRDA